MRSDNPRSTHLPAARITPTGRTPATFPGDSPVGTDVPVPPRLDVPAPSCPADDADSALPARSGEPDPRTSPPADTKEYSAFYRENNKKIFLHLSWLGAPDATAKDIVQDCMLEVYKRWNNVQSPKAYVFKSARRRWVHHCKASQREVPTENLPDFIPRAAVSSEITEFETKYAAMQAIRRLPARRREVMSLHLAGLETDEIADILGIDAATVRSHRKLARKELAPFLEGGEG